MFGKTIQLRTRIDSLQREVRVLEELAAQLADRAGMGQAELSALRDSLEPGITPQIRQLVDEGQYILAIKAYPEETGAGLKEAKEAIDAVRDRQR